MPESQSIKSEKHIETSKGPEVVKEQHVEVPKVPEVQNVEEKAGDDEVEITKEKISTPPPPPESQPIP
ncbi:hypothetical protein Hanom_Chr04g00336381 [Helianthus anomalus]